MKENSNQVVLKSGINSTAFFFLILPLIGLYDFQ